MSESGPVEEMWDCPQVDNAFETAVVSTVQDIAVFIQDISKTMLLLSYHHTISTVIHGEIPASLRVTMYGSRRPVGAQSLDEKGDALLDFAQ